MRRQIMIKTKLPVIVLRNLVLLPHGEIKLEISNADDKNIIDNSIKYHNNYVILVSTKGLINENIELTELPNVGIIGKITSNFELPNNHIRINIEGINRASIFNYIDNKNSNLEAVIGPISIDEIDKDEEEANLRLLKREFAGYISISPNISNNIIIKLNEETNLDKLTDKIANMIPFNFENKNKYIYEFNSVKRSDMLIKQIAEEKNISYIERKIEEKVKRELDKSQQEFILKEKIKAIKEELGETDNKDEEISDLKNKIENLNAPSNIKEKLLKEVNKYEMMSLVSPELSIVKNYIDTVLSLPFGIYTKDLKNIQKIEEELDKTHHGLKDVKNRILEYIAVKELTNDIKSPIICLVGPPGVGKTSLAYSISQALHRNFVKISVGGVNDEAEIIGHRRTYIGSKPGRIIEGLIKAKSSNPVFLIDEIDKMTKDIKGDPSSCLLEVLDPEQNSTFYDNYIEEAFDLSKVMFILTANSLLDIPYALRDRLEIINLTSYTTFEKLDIVKNYMFSKLLKEHGLTKNNLIIDDETINFIIKHYTKEAGVRELERVLSSLMRKIAKEIITGSKRKKFVLNEEDVIRLLGNIKYVDIGTTINNPGVVNGLAYTDLGGSILPIEVSHYKGKGNVNMTGSLGNVMKESAQISIGYIKNNYKEFGVDIKKLNDDDIHINALHAGIPKDGPSAGITLVTAILSSFLNKKIDNKIGMTGEITLNGNILGIGGLREKSIAAYNSGIKKIFIPKENESDISEIPKEVLDSLEIVFVSNYSEIFNNLFN
jgi:ATP-dependent Lon protease